MSVLFTVILPVFIVLGYGYVVAWRGLLTEAGIDALMRFADAPPVRVARSKPLMVSVVAIARRVAVSVIVPLRVPPQCEATCLVHW